MRIQIFFVESSDTCPCPYCQASLKHWDHKRRIMPLVDDEKKVLRVKRWICTDGGCKRLHTVLPDCLVPYKHYASEVIAGVLDDVITPDDTDTEDYPYEATMYRWKHWLMMNYLHMKDYLKSIVHCLLGLEKELLVSTVSLLEKLGLSNVRWTFRMIYNSGGFLESP